MKVSGFSFIRNAIKYDYPVVEALTSILPLCDEVVVAVGKSDDETLALVKNIHPSKIKIIETVWDDSLREGGKVLAIETDKAFNAVSLDSDWAFYIQADEILHEKYIDDVRSAMNHWKENKEIDGLLFDYLHFYGSYNYIGESARWYRKEIRVVRNRKDIFSYKDAQGFRKQHNQKLKVKSADAFIHHYGWVKEPKAMQKKQESFNKYWHNDNWMNKNVKKSELFDYSGIDALSAFKGTHPAVMEERIKRKNWEFDFDISTSRFSLKDKVKRTAEKIMGHRIGEYKNYILV